MGGQKEGEEVAGKPIKIEGVGCPLSFKVRGLVL